GCADVANPAEVISLKSRRDFFIRRVISTESCRARYLTRVIDGATAMPRPVAVIASGLNGPGLRASSEQKSRWEPNHFSSVAAWILATSAESAMSEFIGALPW